MRSINATVVMLLASLGVTNARPEPQTLATVKNVSAEESKAVVVESLAENVPEGFLRLNEVASAAAYRYTKAFKSTRSRSSKSGGGKSTKSVVWKDDIEDTNWNQLAKSAKRLWAAGDAWAAWTGDENVSIHVVENETTSKTGKKRKSGKGGRNKSGKSSTGAKAGKGLKSGKISTKSVHTRR